MGAFVQIVGSLRNSQKILIQVNLMNMRMITNTLSSVGRNVRQLSQDLQSNVHFSKIYLVENADFREANGIRLPHFLPHLVFYSCLREE
ncbi:hypothetical protein R6Q59_000511 [Mikania micrantha]